MFGFLYNAFACLLNHTDSSDCTTTKVVLIGDSTIDNKLWVQDKGLSVVENLRLLLPDALITDLTNDGFTTRDVLKGNWRDKVVSTSELHPHEFFRPLEDGKSSIQAADKIILSIGGNNIREFLLGIPYKPGSILSFNQVSKKIASDYKTILLKLKQLNPTAEIILMTQYYPAFDQEFMRGLNIYKALAGLSVPLSVISLLRGHGATEIGGKSFMHGLMDELFNDVLQFCQERELNGKVVDVTSSLNPRIAANYVSQIEPSATGGYKIAMMLAYATKDQYDTTSSTTTVYRFDSDFFQSPLDNPNHQAVKCYSLNPGTRFTPKHPSQFPRSEHQLRQARI